MQDQHPNADVPKINQPYDVPTSIGQLRSSKMPKYALWVKSQSPKSMQDPPNVNVKTDEGMYYDANAKVLQPEQVRDVCIHANLTQIDAEYVTDLTHVNMIHAGVNELSHVYTWADDIINTPELIEGKTTWVMPNVSNKREESNVTPNVIQWMNFIKKAMNTKEDTTIIFGQPLPYITVDPQMNVRLDRRIIQLATRRWLANVIYQGVPQFYVYDALPTSKTYRRMIPITSVKNEPYVFYIFNSKKSFVEYNFIHLNVDKMVDVNKVDNKQTVHCRVDANPRLCCSSNQFIKLINGHPSDMQSSAFQNLETQNKLPLPPTDISKRIAKITTTKPYKWWVVDLHTSAEEYEKIEKDRLREIGVHMGLVNDDENNVIASKFPLKGQKKQEANEVRDALFLSPPACESIETAVVLNRYDVLVSLKPGTDIVRLAGIWETVDKITMQSAMHSTRIFGDAKTVTPPKVMVNYPPVITLSKLNNFMNQFGSVQDIQIEKQGTAMCTFVFLESAYVSVGVHSPFGQYGIVSVTSGSMSDDKAYNSKLDNYHTHTADLNSRKAYGSQFLKLTPSSLQAALEVSTSSKPASMNTDPPYPRREVWTPP